MLEKITISKVATFNEDEQVFDELGKVNFIFGHNGSGKTTVSRIIKNPDKNDYKNCKIEKDNSGASEPDILVYNRDFIKENIEEADVKKIPGIFTIGSGGIKIREKIIYTQGNVRKTLRAKEHIAIQEAEKQSELKKERKKFIESCWNAKDKYQKRNLHFKTIFKNFGGSKEKFADELLKVHDLLPKEYVDENIEALISQINKLYEGDLAELKLVEKFSFDEINKFTKDEKDEILQKKIIGSEDVDIANMINKLNNADWVRQGIPFYEQNEEYCPFCQQIAPDNFADSLADYFDDEYDAGVKKLENYKDDYTESEKYIINKLNNIMENIVFEKLENTDTFEIKIEGYKKDIENIFQQNIQKIESKIKEPSVLIFLESIEEALTNINEIIDNVNVMIEKNNTLYNNQEDGKSKLKNNCWNKIASEKSVEIINYKKDKEEIEKTINQKLTLIKSKEKEIEDLNKIISDSKKDLGLSIEPVAEKINEMLEKFGFSGLKLETIEIEDEGTYYNIIRNDGTPVEESLSEGEKTFITFLYFYYLCEGSHEQENILNDRIVVIDDPVSSLDSNAMFFVSQMIKKLIGTVITAKDTEANLKQIFILTHNIYFHKQVTFLSQGEKSGESNDRKFWIIRKKNNLSCIGDPETENPIKNSYEMLWLEISHLRDYSIGMQNALRRILEYYFTHLGYLEKINEIVKEFETEEDKLIVRSLISWAHTGSHDISDDFYYVETADNNNFIRVFKQIFIGTNHKGHYDMMIKNIPEDHPIKILEQQEEGNNTSQNEDAELQS